MVGPLRFVSLRKSWAVFGNRRWPSEIFWNNLDLSQNGRKLVDILNKTILAFLKPFFASSSWKKFTVSKCYKAKTVKCLVLSRYPHSNPLLGTALTTARLAEGCLSVFWQKKKKKKDFIATIECGKIRQKPGYTVNEVPLTKNSLRAPFVARNNSLLRPHWRPTLCGSRKQNKNAR